MGLSWELALMSLATGIAGNFDGGYLSTVLSQPYIVIEQHINESWIERTGQSISVESLSFLVSAIVNVDMVGRMIGQMVALYLCDQIGRKKTALFGSILVFPACLLSIAAKYMLTAAIELLFISRLIWSLGNGLLVVNMTIWLIEAAPVKYRGTVSSMQEVLQAIGTRTRQPVLQLVLEWRVNSCRFKILGCPISNCTFIVDI
jgi:MFS family permease